MERLARRLDILEACREAALERERDLILRLENALYREERLAERVEELELWKEEAVLREEAMKRRMTRMTTKLEEIGDCVDGWRAREERRGRVDSN